MSSLVHLTFWKKANSLFIDISDEESAAAFINEFQEITSTSYNFKAGTQDQRDTKTLPCSGARKCIHNVTKFSKKNSNEARADQQPGKNSRCEANYSFKLFKKSSTPYNLMIILHYKHNHSVKSTGSLKFKSVSKQTIEALSDLSG